MEKQPIKYYIHDGPASFRFELAGVLEKEGARRLVQDWRTASSMMSGRVLVIDMTFVTGVDEHGHALIARWHGEGARLIANSKVSRALAQSILGEALPEQLRNTETAPLSKRAWLPFRGWFVSRAVPLVLLAAMLFPSKATAATLKPETVAAWDSYLQTADTDLADRIRPGGRFLWTMDDSERASKVQSGEIVVAPAPGQNPRKVPGGLIHHWMGAVFLPGLKLDQVLEVTRDYDHYKEFYRPYVIDSKLIGRGDRDDQFSMLLMNKALFLKNVLDADYRVTSVHLDARRFYSVSTTTRVQEIEEFGQAGEHADPEGKGGGYIWKLRSIARLEERQDGAYLELEAIALSRDIPAAARLLVEPIVRRVSRNSLLISLEQTNTAVTARAGDRARSLRVPAKDGQTQSRSRSAFVTY